MSKMIAQRYMVVSSLGEGGMADVYLAVDTILNREVAVKVLRKELSEDHVTLLRFLREASAVSKMHHPNIVEVYDVGEYEGQQYIVMECVRGRTLKQLILQRGALQKEEAIDIMKQIVSAVAHAHSKKIIHRDIKPQNVLMKDDGSVKITDFGISLAHDAIQLTQSDSVLGSAHYIAPETTKGEVASEQTDIYALGIVFYELLSGRVPFSGENLIQVAMKHSREEIPSIIDFNPTLPQSVENIIIRATAKNRVNRYHSAKEMLFDLETCLLAENVNAKKVDLLASANAQEGHTIIAPGIQATPKLDKEEIEVEAPTTKKESKKPLVFIIVGAIALIAILTAIILAATGVIGGGEEAKEDKEEEKVEEKTIQVPDLSNMSLEDAKDAIEDAGLTLDSDITYEYTDEYEKGVVYEQYPKADSEVDEDAEITLKVSSGKYFVIKDYKGYTLEEVEQDLANTNVVVYKEYMESKDAIPGTVVSQSKLSANQKVEPDVGYVISVVIAQAPSLFVENYGGMSIDTVRAQLENKGISVKVIEQSYSALLAPLPESATEEEKLARTQDILEHVGMIYDQNPKAGSTYEQSGSNVFTLYVYIE